MRDGRPTEIRIRSDTREYLFDRPRLERVRVVLSRLVDAYARTLRFVRDERADPGVLVDLHDAGAIFDLISSQFARPADPQRLEVERKHGAAGTNAQFGMCSLRSPSGDIEVFISVDSRGAVRIGGKGLLVNGISVLLSGDLVDSAAGVEKAAEFVGELSDAMGADHSFACDLAEYDSKNISRERGGTRAIGLDYTKALPGLYWINFFGPLLTSSIGEERLLSAPAYETRRVGTGVWVRLSRHPQEWREPTYVAVQEAVLDRLGRELFFSRADPERRTRIPDFGFGPVSKESPPLRVRIDTGQEPSRN